MDKLQLATLSSIINRVINSVKSHKAKIEVCHINASLTRESHYTSNYKTPNPKAITTMTSDNSTDASENK